MYVCMCSGVTESEITQYINNTTDEVSLENLQNDLNVCNGCGQCECHLNCMIDSFQQKNHNNLSG